MFLLKNKRLRRYAGAALVLAGGLLMWFSPETGIGLLLFSVAIVIELVGIWLEHKRQD